MARATSSRWAIFVHDPDGDMGFGRVVGPFRDPEKAEEKAEQIRREGVRMVGGIRCEPECIVLQVEAGGTSARAIVEAVL